MLRVRSYVVTYLGANFLTYRICGIQYVYWALESCLGYLTLAHLLDLVVVMSIHICKLYLKTSVYPFIKIYYGCCATCLMFPTRQGEQHRGGTEMWADGDIGSNES